MLIFVPISTISTEQIAGVVVPPSVSHFDILIGKNVHRIPHFIEHNGSFPVPVDGCPLGSPHRALILILISNHQIRDRAAAFGYRCANSLLVYYRLSVQQLVCADINIFIIPDGHIPISIIRIPDLLQLIGISIFFRNSPTASNGNAHSRILSSLNGEFPGCAGPARGHRFARFRIVHGIVQISSRL